MSLSDAYMDALCRYLQDRYEAAPPVLATIGVLKVGSYQENDLTNTPAVVSIYSSDPLSESSTHIEMIVEQASSGGGRRHALDGGYTEMGDDGKGAAYWYYWWVRCEYFMTRTGLEQDKAREVNGDLLGWLRQQIQTATPRTIGLVQDETAQLLHVRVNSVTTRERGGKPTSYIWSSLIKLRGLVYGD